MKQHGFSQHPLYFRWRSIRERCHKSEHPDYPSYGGRGIKLCDEWLHDRTKFFEWALANGYDKKLQLDRIDNNKGYSPDNCRFVSPKVNSRNRNHYKHYTYNGITACLYELVERFCPASSPHVIYMRVRNGWPIESALKHPVVPKPRRLTKY
jgi:hypothetical protein